MDRLHVFDVSAMVFCGGSHQDDFYNYPVGGIKYLADRIAVALGDNEDIVLCFDSPSFRSSGDSHYKHGRIPRPAIYSQIETIYDGLSQCGFYCEKYNGYEADDIIEWAVAEHYKEYYYGTTIYGNDMDLCHSIRNGVQFVTTTTAMNDINITNFKTAIYKGKEIPFNTISAYKVFCGCHSDTIPALVTERKLNTYKLFQLWCNTMNKYGPLSAREIGANPKMVIAFAEGSGLFTQTEIDDIKQRVALIFPAEKPDSIKINVTTPKQVDKTQLQYFLSLYNCSNALRCLKMNRINLTENQKNDLRNRARSLKSGAYAADKNLEADSKKVQSKMIDLESFTREF